MWASTHSMDQVEKERPHWGKETAHRWKKGITGLVEIAVYKIAFQRASVGIFIKVKLPGGDRASF